MVFSVISAICLTKYRSLNKALAEEFISNPYFADPNCDGDGISLTTINGIGKTFVGKFRKAKIGNRDSYVSYHCLLLLFVCIPQKCYRVVPEGAQSFYIIGSETFDNREATCIRYRFYGIISLALAICSILILIIFM